jgi:hypothetical protein
MRFLLKSRICRICNIKAHDWNLNLVAKQQVYQNTGIICHRHYNTRRRLVEPQGMERIPVRQKLKMGCGNAKPSADTNPLAVGGTKPVKIVVIQCHFIAILGIPLQ